MNRPFETFGAALLTSAFCLFPIACDSPEQDRPVAAAKLAPTFAPESAPESDIEFEPEPEISIDAPVVDAQPVLASAVELPVAPPAAAATRKPQSADSLRSPSLLPAGTPEANIIAFTNLRLSKRDKAPIAGAGETGIHLDELELGKGWASSRCEQPDRRFVVEQDERINLCFRVVHPREDESVTVEWSRDGKLRQSINVHVAPTHAYLTRAWMPVTEGRVGEWTATVKSSDGVVLGQLAFEVSK